MAIPTYTPGYPPDGSSLGQTKSTVRNNLDGTFETLGVDHVDNNGDPGMQPAGYHTVVHMVPQSGNPGAVTGYGQLFSKIITSVISDTALFWETGTGLVQQLTSNVVPSAVTNGYTFLPGGILIQWGTVTAAVKNAATDVSFNAANISFPNACFAIIGSLSSGTTTSTLTITPKSELKFNYYLNSNSAQTINFCWVAIGN
jgi:hypothetical protein